MNDRLKTLLLVVIVMSIATLLHVHWLMPRVSAPMPATLLLLGVFVCAIYGGLWAGFLAAAIAVGAAMAAAPASAGGADRTVQLVLLASAGVAAALIAHGMRRARARADADRLALRRQMQERAATEMRLASSEQRFRTVVDALPDVVFVADGEGRLRTLNEHWLDAGSDAGRADASLFTLVFPDDVARVRRAWREAIDARVPLDIRCRLRSRAGDYRWALLRAQLSAVANAGGTQWFGVVVDVTKTVAAERALRDSDERLQLALAATGLGSFELDFESGEQRLNETARSMLGFGADIALTNAIVEAQIEPSDLARVRAAIEKARTGGDGSQFDLEYRFRRPDDTWRWIAMRGKCFADALALGQPAMRCLGTLHDITDRRDAERALAAAAERLRLALDATELGMWDYDFATGAIVCSAAVYAIAGLDPARSVMQAAWLALVVPEDEARVLEHARRAAEPPLSTAPDGASEEHGGLDVEFRVRRASDGAIRWVVLTGRVSFDEGAPRRAARATGTLRDVTRRRESTERLRNSEERLALAQQAGRIGMFDWDLATDAVACSITEEALLGLEPGTFAGTYAALRAQIHPGDQQAVATTLGLALDRQDSYADEFRIVRPDRAVRWISAQASITRRENGTPLRMIGVHRDVTEDKLAGRRLEASEERFRLATEALDGLLYDFDPVEDRVERSRGLFEMTGFHAEEVPPTGAWWRARVHGDDRARIESLFEKAVAERALRIEQEYRVQHRDGHWVHVNDRALLVWRHGIVCRTVGVAIDVTERRRIERVLHDADRRKDEFLAVLAHELRNPLAPIRNAVQVIARRPDPDVVTAAAAVLERQVSQMVRLIDDLLDVSRIAQGKLKLRRRRTGLRSIVEAAVETVAPLLRARRQAFEYSLPEKDVTIDADGVRLSQVIANLLHNASKYTQARGRIELAAQIHDDDQTIGIRVTDNGVGIAAQSLEGIFTMFSQLAQDEDATEGAVPATARHDGLGIGLALARAVVELHHGTIHAASEGANRGATFLIRLPLCDAASAPGATVPTSQEPRRWRILVVDDNRDSAESLAAVLRLDRHEVFVAYGGRAALVTAERENPDLILLDIGMPDIDGYEVARMLRAGEVTAAARIVALSGYGQAADREKSIAAGCDGHLVKPVAPEDLAAWLKPAAPDVRRGSPAA